MTEEQQEEAIDLLERGKKLFRELQGGRSITSWEMNVEEFLQQIEDEENPFK